MKFAIICVFGFLLMQTNQNCNRRAMENSNIKSTPMPQKTATTTPTPQKTITYDRLPPDVELDSEVRKDILNDKGEVTNFEIITVEKRLQELKARYEKDVLVDGKGREIKFYEPFCRGASAGFEEDQKEMQAKAKALEDMQKKYTVIFLYCDPRKAV